VPIKRAYREGRGQRDTHIERLSETETAVDISERTPSQFGVDEVYRCDRAHLQHGLLGLGCKSRAAWMSMSEQRGVNYQRQGADMQWWRQQGG
jgi:hypothetical protein